MAAAEEAHKPLELPAATASSPTSRPVTFLRSWLSYFVEASDPDVASHKVKASDFATFYDLHFEPNAIVEFPYMPREMRTHIPNLEPLTVEDEDGGRLVGREAIIAYFGEWRSTFWFDRGSIKTLAAFDEGRKGVIEARLWGRLLNTEEPKDYFQDYVSFVEFEDSGKVMVYREHWAANRFQ